MFVVLTLMQQLFKRKSPFVLKKIADTNASEMRVWPDLCQQSRHTWFGLFVEQYHYRRHSHSQRQPGCLKRYHIILCWDDITQLSSNLFRDQTCFWQATASILVVVVLQTCHIVAVVLHANMSHDTNFSILSTPFGCTCNSYFLEQLKSLLFNFFKKLPINYYFRIFGPDLIFKTNYFPKIELLIVSLFMCACVYVLVCIFVNHLHWAIRYCSKGETVWPSMYKCMFLCTCVVSTRDRSICQNCLLYSTWGMDLGGGAALGCMGIRQSRKYIWPQVSSHMQVFPGNNKPFGFFL